MTFTRKIGRLAYAAMLATCATSGALAEGVVPDSLEVELGAALHVDDASLPDPAGTPGDFDDRAKVKDLCSNDAGAAPTTPDKALCDSVFADRRIADEHRYEYTCSFLVPTTIGGALTKKNVWLQPASEVRWKRTLDGDVLKRICNRELPVSQAQREVAGDWVAAYRRYILPNDRLIVGAQPAYDPKDDPGRSRTVRGLVQDGAVTPADVPQSGGQNSQPIEASVTPGLGQSSQQSGLQGGGGGAGGAGIGGGVGNRRSNSGNARSGTPTQGGPIGRGPRSIASGTHGVAGARRVVR